MTTVKQIDSASLSRLAQISGGYVQSIVTELEHDLISKAISSLRANKLTSEQARDVLVSLSAVRSIMSKIDSDRKESLAEAQGD